MKAVTSNRSASDAVTNAVEMEIRDLVRELNRDDVVPVEVSNEVTIRKISAGAIAEIDRLMDELQAARTYVHAEGERLRHAAERYVQLTRTAVAAVHIISERMREWHNVSALVAATEARQGRAPVHEPPAPAP